MGGVGAFFTFSRGWAGWGRPDGCELRGGRKTMEEAAKGGRNIDHQTMSLNLPFLNPRCERVDHPQ